MFKRFSVSILLTGFVLGCTSTATVPRPSAYVPAAVTPPSPSLFSSDSAILTDDEIKRILSHRFVPEAQSRVGVLTIGQQSWWSDELARLGEETQRNLITQLRSSRRIYAASYLPSFLVPEKRSVALFREAGARYQADLLLIYRTFCRSYEKYQFFGSDESKAYCNVEGALLDVRTGIVPFTVVTSRDFSAVKRAEDVNFEETIRKAEMNALGEALKEVGARVVEFLDTGNAQVSAKAN